jgi:hypothetical protein
MTGKKEGGEANESVRRDAAGRKLTPQARRALEEAAARRAAQKTSAKTAAGAKKEIGGRDGPEPIRYGDWEVKGRVSDF